MKQLAVILAAMLTLTLVAPAFAQPFADVPTDHWAYDAIAELAAKGLIEGYPDGAFRGDRAMTRYEMAMVVARLLARIEAIKIPPLPPDLVRRAELQKADAATRAALTAQVTVLRTKLATVQRLVAEFRAELAALGVRVTAVEEELAALRARLDNTRITGDMRFRYNVYPSGSVSSSAGSSAWQPDGRLRARITFTGRGGPNTEAVVRMFAANNANTTGIFDQRIGNNYAFGNVSFDLLYVDVRNTYGANLWRVGRQFYTLAGFGGFGVGLLYDPANSISVGLFLPTGTTPYGTGGTAGVSDGIRADWVLGPLNITTAVFRKQTPPGTATGSSGNPPLRDDRMVRATTSAFLPGWTLGASYYQQLVKPAISAATAFVMGGTGWGFDISGNLMPGFSFYLDYASWTAKIDSWLGTSATLPAATAWRVGGNINLAQVAGIQQWNPNIDWAYQNYGPLPAGCPGAPAAAHGCYPHETYATTITGQGFAWNMRGYLVRLNLTLSPRTNAFVLYEGGTVLCTVFSCGAGSTTGTYSEYWLRLTHTIAPRTTVALNAYKGNASPAAIAGTTSGDWFNFYRAELLYSW